MKSILTILSLFIFLSGSAQYNEQYLGTKENTVRVRNALAVDSGLVLPKDTLKSAPVGSFAAKNGYLYLKSATGWKQAIDSVNAKYLHVAYNPSNLTKQPGQSATFGVVVSGGKTPYKYLWQKGVTSRTGDTLASMVILTTALSDTGNYRVRVTDSLGNIIYSQYANLSMISVGGGGGGGTTTGQLSADSVNDGTTKKAFLATERTKLSGIATGATVNSSDAALRDRSTHTGVQGATTITEDATHRFTTDAEKVSWNAKQSTLISGSNIKTINGQPLLGAGNITVSGGGGSSTISADSVVETSGSKVMTSAERTKLAAIATFATANSSDATLLARSNHTGVQAQSTVTNLVSDLAAKQDAATAVTLTGNQTLTGKSISGTTNTFLNIPQSAVITLTADLAQKQTQAQVSAIVHDSLGPVKIIRNKPGAGDSLLVVSGDSLLLNRFSIESGTNITVSRIPVPGGYTFVPNFTGSTAAPIKMFDVTSTTHTPSLANGYQQKFFYNASGAGTFTLSTSTDANSSEYTIINRSASGIAFNVNVYEDGSTFVTAGAAAIAAGKRATLNKDFTTGRWYIALLNP